ncbi:hypothetical protein [Chitinimonas taiwanensis]|uniref:hypothetical protein n=1 Tax=Chitinimonas taiwanensis TaxID=240412 RepID=UPI0035AE2853
MKKLSLAVAIATATFVYAADTVPDTASDAVKALTALPKAANAGNVKTVATDWRLAPSGAGYIEKSVKITVSPNVSVGWGENNTSLFVATGSAKGTGAVFGVSTAGGSASKCSAASVKTAPKDTAEIVAAVAAVSMDDDGALTGCNEAAAG